MNNMYNLLIIFIFFTVNAQAQERTLPGENAEPGVWKFGLRTDYAKGNYGTPDKFVDTFATLSGQYEWERVSLKISMPYIWSRTDSQVTIDPEEGGVICDTNCPTVNQTEKVSGRGNLSLSLSYSIPKEEDGIELTMTGKIRFGTADPDKGLGTGKTDYALDFEFSRAFGDVTPLLGIGYRWRGKPYPESSIVDSPYAWAGFIYSINDASDAELYYGYRRPSSINSLIAGRDISVSLYHRLNKRIRFNASLGKGLSVNNPDWFGGLGVGVKY
jgi:hypothetical protein